LALETLNNFHLNEMTGTKSAFVYPTELDLEFKNKMLGNPFWVPHFLLKLGYNYSEIFRVYLQIFDSKCDLHTNNTQIIGVLLFTIANWVDDAEASLGNRGRSASFVRKDIIQDLESCIYDIRVCVQNVKTCAESHQFLCSSNKAHKPIIAEWPSQVETWLENFEYKLNPDLKM